LSFSIWLARTAALSTFRMSMEASSVLRKAFTPMIFWWPESMRACVRAAASSIFNFGMPASMAFAMPPRLSTSWICAQALSASS
jgi:hypothetical protein